MKFYFYLEALKNKQDLESLYWMILDDNEFVNSYGNIESAENHEEYERFKNEYFTLLKKLCNKYIKQLNLNLDKNNVIEKLFLLDNEKNQGLILPDEPYWDINEDYEPELIDQASYILSLIKKKHKTLYENILKHGYTPTQMIELLIKDEPETSDEFIEDGFGGILRTMKNGSIRIRDKKTRKFVEL